MDAATERLGSVRRVTEDLLIGHSAEEVGMFKVAIVPQPQGGFRTTTYYGFAIQPAFGDEFEMHSGDLLPDLFQNRESAIDAARRHYEQVFQQTVAAQALEPNQSA